MHGDMSYASQCIAMTSSHNNTTIQTYLAVLADEVVGLIVKERYWQPKLKGLARTLTKLLAILINDSCLFPILMTIFLAQMPKRKKI